MFERQRGLEQNSLVRKGAYAMDLQSNIGSQDGYKMEDIKKHDRKLINLYFEHKEKTSDKWEQYLSVYASELAPYIAHGKPVRLLEIGVQNGGSLEIWSKYLPEGSKIIGIDIDPKVLALKFVNENIEVVLLDITDMAKATAFLEGRQFDLIIDDASHVSSEIIAAFDLCYKYLAPGGKYIIEDLHASYFSSHGGGYLRPDSAIEWLKSLVDTVNADHIQQPGEFVGEDREAKVELNQSIQKVSFYDSMAVIEKLEFRKLEPYRRLRTGLDANVVPIEKFIYDIDPGNLKKIMFAEHSAKQIDAAILDDLIRCRAEIQKMQTEMNANLQSSCELKAFNESDPEINGTDSISEGGRSEAIESNIVSNQRFSSTDDKSEGFHDSSLPTKHDPRQDNFETLVNRIFSNLHE